MGGFGSGGWNRKGKPSVEDSFPITVKALREFGYLGTWKTGLLRFGESSISITRETGASISLEWSPKGGRVLRSLEIKLKKVPRQFGGIQTYLVCPTCRMLKSAIFYYDDWFACRDCQGLSYDSQRERPYWRIRRKVAKLARRLGCEYLSGMADLPKRPIGMHITTYRKLAEEFNGYAQWLNRMDRSITLSLEARLASLPEMKLAR